MICLILIPLIAAALFFTWALCRASAMADADDERAFQEWLQRKDVNSHEGA